MCAPKHSAEAKSSVCFSLGCVLGGMAVLCLLFLRAPQFFGLTASGASAPGLNDEPVMSQARISALEAALEPARASAADWRAPPTRPRPPRRAGSPSARRARRRRRARRPPWWPPPTPPRADRRRVVRGRGRALRRLGVAGRVRAQRGVHEGALRQIVRHVRDRPLLRRQHRLLAVGGAGRVQEEPDLHAPQLQEELRPVRGGRLGPSGVPSIRVCVGRARV